MRLDALTRCAAWRGLKRKPLEWRTLRSPTSSVSQGKILCFVEVLEPAEARRDPLMNIKPPPPELYELRVIIWGVRDTACKDLSSKMNDLYVTAQPSVQSLKEQRTDIHLRAKKGKGNFNWRMKFPIELPCKPRGTWPRLKMQIWDMDIIGANDAIAEAVRALRERTLPAVALAQRELTRVRVLVTVRRTSRSSGYASRP